MIKPPIILIGIGELGGELARGFLRCGHPVIPVTRGSNLGDVSEQYPSPALVLITVQEHELQNVLLNLPTCWKNKVGLLQNELLPRDWQAHDLQDPTITVIWFEKKPGMVITNILYSPVFGPNAAVIADALKAINIPTKILDNKDALLYELVRKSVYILTVNICGLVENCTVSELWRHHQPLAEAVAKEVVQLQAWLTGERLSYDRLVTGMVEGIDDCPNRKCLGRSAPARLQRALKFSEQAGIDTPKLHEIHQLSIKEK